MSFRNARVYFVTASGPTSAEALLHEHLAERGALAFSMGGVWLGKHRLTDGKRMLSKGQTLKVYVTPVQTKTYIFSSSQIVKETDDWMIVRKPAGITTVSDRSHTQNNLTYGVEQYYASLDNPYRPTPITRLDYMVDGLVLYPKNKYAERDLFRMSMHRTIGKYYIARLGPFPNPPKCLRIKDALAFRDKSYIEAGGKVAHSLFILRSSSEEFIEYGVMLFTGRRHQIRCHAAHYLSPILGDSLYGSTHKLPGNRLALTAYGYNFLWKNERMRIRVENGLFDKF
jgi:23S rRNA pseudouridine1911/1915/1917 synthase